MTSARSKPAGKALQASRPATRARNARRQPLAGVRSAHEQTDAQISRNIEWKFKSLIAVQPNSPTGNCPVVLPARAGRPGSDHTRPWQARPRAIASSRTSLALNNTRADIAAVVADLRRMRGGISVAGQASAMSGQGKHSMPRTGLGHLTLVSRHPADLEEFTDQLWVRLRREAEQAYATSPMLAPLFLDSIVNQPSFEAAVIHRVGARLKNDVISLPLIVQAWHRAASGDPGIIDAIRADIIAVYERDPACERFLEPFLYFKGFHAIQAHRLTHWLWGNGERDFALYLQSRSSEVFQTDIHPAARFGRGIFLDHATGLVVGETSVVGDDVSMLQDVTLGGTGKEAGDRHPKIRRGVMIGAGAKILGNIEVGQNARIAAGSVVLRSVPPHTTVAGVPARTVRTETPDEPSRTMDQVLRDLSYEAFNYTI